MNFTASIADQSLRCRERNLPSQIRRCDSMRGQRLISSTQTSLTAEAAEMSAGTKCWQLSSDAMHKGRRFIGDALQTNE